VCATGYGIRRSKDLRAEIGKCPISTNERKNMSTKTNFKRVALVAAAALGLGVLTSVAPANATDGDITVSTTAVTGTTGVLVAASGSAATQAITISTTGQVTLTLDTSTTGSATVTGPCQIKPSFLASYTSTATTVFGGSGQSVSNTTDQNTFVTVVPTGTAGTCVVKAFATAAAAAAGTNADKVVITVAAASTVNAYDAGKSSFSTEASGQSASDNVDATYTSASGITLVPASRVINGGAGYFGYSVKDANGNALVGNVIGANVTGANCLVGAAGAGTFNAASSTTAASYFQVSQAVVNTPATCVVSISVNGSPVSSRTFTIQGEVTKISVDVSPARLKASSTANAAAVYASALDAAGNSIDNVVLAPDTTYYNTSLTNITSITTKVGSLVATDNSADITCTAKGAVKMKFKTTNASSVSIKSDELSTFCAGSPLTYSASLDKASYVSGDIATLTITAKDSAGNLTHDYAALGAKVEIAGSNMTAVSAATSVDTFTNGVAKYKFIVGATEGSYQMVVDLPAYNDATTPQSAVTVSYKIAGNGGVSNADVLKAIVSLIASINKQIAALQKALLKK
jgi:hypothetical protein